MILKDFTGRKFNKLTVLEYSHSDHKSYSFWKCRCDCGDIVIKRGSHLSSGGIKSCGKCLRSRASKHGGCGTHEYHCWQSMKSRCLNPNEPNYHNYGGRGITVCGSWIEFSGFIADMGQSPTPKHSIDRIDVNGNYEPGNCRWATAKEQNLNRRDTRMLTHKGISKPILTWARENGLTAGCIKHRLIMGWDVETAITKKSIRG